MVTNPCKFLEGQASPGEAYRAAAHSLPARDDFANGTEVSPISPDDLGGSPEGAGKGPDDPGTAQNLDGTHQLYLFVEHQANSDGLCPPSPRSLSLSEVQFLFSMMRSATLSWDSILVRGARHAVSHSRNRSRYWWPSSVLVRSASRLVVDRNPVSVADRFVKTNVFCRPTCSTNPTFRERLRCDEALQRIFNP